MKKAKTLIKPPIWANLSILLTINPSIIFKIIIGIIIISLVFGVISYNYVVLPKASEKKLTATQIEELRKIYPICDETPPLVSMGLGSLETTKSIADSFIYGEVIGELSTHSTYISTGIKELDAKREQYGMNTNTYFFEYTLKVINDTENKYKKGEQVTISANIIFKDTFPALSKGMKVVVPVAKNKGENSRTFYDIVGMYYVTEDGYALSVYTEDNVARTSLSGLTVEALLKELKK